MHGRAIVPHHEIAQPPFVLVEELRLRDVRPQRFQHRVRLFAGIAFDIGIAPAPEIERGAAVRRMAQDRRMPGARRGDRIVGRRHAFAQVAAGIVGAVVLDAPAFDLAPQIGGQGIAGGLHAAEPGVAAGRRDFQREQHRGVGRRVEIAHVCVPDGLAVAERADRISVPVEHVRHDIDVGIAGRADPAAFLVGRRVEFAEAAAERQEIVVGELLAGQQDHRMAMPGTLDSREVGIAQAAQIDAGDFRADGRRERAHCHGHRAPAMSFLPGRDDRPAAGRVQAPRVEASQPRKLSAMTGATGPAKPGSFGPETVLRLWLTSGATIASAGPARRSSASISG